MIQSLDERALLYIEAHLRNEVLTPIFRLFTYLGDAGAIWILLGAALLLFSATRKRGLVVLLSLGAAALLNNLVIKVLVARPRPYTVLQDLHVLIALLGSYSFPSGHASSSFACATALCLLFGRRGAWSFIPAALIALSRPYLGVHYVSDILFGALLGAACAFAVVRLVQKKTRLLQ